MQLRPANLKADGSARFQGLVSAVFVAGLAILSARIVWLMVSPTAVLAKPTDLPEQAASEQPASLGVAAANHSLLVSQNPFTDGEFVEGGVAEDDAPETSLNLTLNGIRYSSLAEGVAFIQMPDGEEIFGQAGDTLFDNVSIEKVLPTHITLRRDGALESLYPTADSETVLIPFSEDDGGDEDTELVHLRRVGEPDAARTVPGEDDFGDQIDDDIDTVSADDQAERQDASTRSAPATNGTSGPRSIRTRVTDPTDLVRHVQFRLEDDGEDGTGYRVQSRGDAQILRDIGFEPSDLVRAINGKPVEKLDDRDVQDLLTLSRRVRFDILRESGPVQIIVSIGEEG